MCAYLCKLWAEGNNKPIDLATLIVTFLTFLTALGGGITVVWQISGVNRTIHSQSESTMDQVTLDFDKTLLEHPDVIPYLEGHPDLTKETADEKNKVAAIATMQLDYIDTYRGQKDELDDGPYQTKAWENYFARIFTQNSVLCEVWITQPCEHSRGVEKIARKFCPRMIDPKLIPPLCSDF